MKTNLITLILCLSTLSMCTLVHAVDIFHPAVFNWIFYLNTNADLTRSGLMTEGKEGRGEKRNRIHVYMNI